MPPTSDGGLHRAPASVLVLTGQADEARAAALRALAPATAEATLVPAGEAPPDPAGYGAVLVDGTPASLPAGYADRLAAVVRRGASLLLLGGFDRPPPAGCESAWEELAAVRCSGRLPFGEWYARVAFPPGALVRRLPEEFALTDELELLEPAGGSTPLLTASIAFTERPLVLERRLGAGRVVASGIGATVAALSDPYIARIFRRSLLPAVGAPGPERPMGIGVLGFGPYGGMGVHHGRAARATEGIELVAACDADPARRKAAAAEFPGLHTVPTATELAADDDVEIVVVATPPSSHAALGLQMMRAGKHVVLEKPMCLSLAEADELLETAASTGTSLTVYQSRRWDADFLAIRRAVEGGLLGEVFNVETFVGGFQHPCRAWHSEVSVSGGAVYDWGSHHLDWIHLLVGELPDTVVSHGHKRVWHDVTNLDQVRVRLTWSDGREAEFVQSDVAGVRRPKFYVQGTAGTLVGRYRSVVLERLEPGRGYLGERLHHAEAPAELLLARYEPAYGLTETVLPPVEVALHPFHRNLADHLHLGEPLAVTPQSARSVVALLEAAQRSSDLGNVPVQLARS